MGMKIYTRVLDHMTKMTSMSINGTKTSSPPEPMDRWPWDIVCSIGYTSTGTIVQMMTLD